MPAKFNGTVRFSQRNKGTSRYLPGSKRTCTPEITLISTKVFGYFIKVSFFNEISHRKLKSIEITNGYRKLCHRMS